MNAADAAPTPARRPRRRAAPGSQTRAGTASAPTPTAMAAYWSAARDGERDLRRLAGLLAAEQLRDRLARARRACADREHEAARDDVPVGRDDAVGRRVGAVAGGPASGARRAAARARPGGRRRPRRPGCPRESKTRTAPKVPSTDSSKRKTTCGGRGLQRRAALAASCACTASRARHGAAGAPRARARHGARRHAPARTHVTRPPSPAGSPTAGPRRRRTRRRLRITTAIVIATSSARIANGRTGSCCRARPRTACR